MSSPIIPEVTHLKSNIPAITNLPNIPVTITFNVPVAKLEEHDFVITNGSISSINKLTDMSYEFVVSPVSEGEVRLNIVDDKVDEGTQKVIQKQDDLVIIYDITPPQITVTTTSGTPTKAVSFPITISATEALKDFASSDITATNATVSNFIKVTDSLYTATVTPLADGLVSIYTPAGVSTDLAGNPNLASAAVNIIADKTGPLATINQSSGQSDPINTLPISFTVVFSEPIDPATFDASDISQAGTSTGVTWSLSTVDNTTWTLLATAATPGTVVPVLAANKVADIAGNSNVASTSTDNSVTYDLGNPSVTIDQSLTQADPTNTLPISFTVVFSKAVNPTTFTPADIVQNGTATGITWALNTSDNITWTLQATSVSGAGTLIPSIAAGQVFDFAGNSNTASTSTDNSVLYDVTVPTVTVNQDASQVDPTNTLPIVFKVVFSEVIDPSSFTTADITQNGTAAGITWNLSTSDNITWTLEASAITTPGTVAPSIALNKVIDLAGNGNAASTSTDNTVIYDLTPPTVTLNQAVGQVDPTNTLPVTFTIAFSEAIDPATFTTADITQSGTASGITWALNTSDNITWTLEATAITTAGTVVPSLAAAVLKDPAGNDNLASTSTDNSVTYDLTAPTVTIDQELTQADPTNALPISFKVIFSKPIDPLTFTVSDITQTGSALGITWSLSTSDNIIWTLEATAVSVPGTLIPIIAANQVKDISGNFNSASTSTDNSVLYDITAPALTINQAAGQADPTNTLPIAYTIVFSEAIDPGTFSTADISQSGTATGITWNLTTSDNITWTLEATAVATPGTIIPSVNAAKLTDPAGNANLASTSTDNTVTYDLTAPTLTINQAAGQVDPANTLPIVYTVVFSEAIDPATFTTADISQSGTAAGITWNLTTSDNITWTLEATAVSTPGTVIPSIAANTVKDPAGNDNAASTSSDNSVVYDTSAPTLTINQAAGQIDPTNSLPISFTIVFSEAIDPATFNVSDITQNGTASGITWNLTTSDNITWNLQATSITTPGTVIPSLPAASVTDVAGNNNSASTSTDNSVVYDIGAPAVTVNQSGGQVDPTNTLPISFTVTFSESIDPASFTISDITQNGTATGITWNLTTSDNITWTLEATAITGEGTVIPSLPAGQVVDLANNGNAASTSTDNTVVYDVTPPTLAITSTELNPTNNSPFMVTFTFSEAVANFTLGDIVVGNGAASGFTTVSPTTYTALITPGINGLVTVDVPAGVANDLAGNQNLAATQYSITYDGVIPALTIEQAVGQADPTNALPITFAISFNKAIDPATFTVSDITQNGTASGITWNLTTTDNKDWTLTATAISSAGTVIPSIAANTVKDTAGNNNLASTSADNSVIYDITAPTLTIDQLGTQVDPTNNLPIKFKIVFSEAINPSTLTTSDITQNGTATGITWNLTTADNITWNLEATAVTGPGTLVPSIAAGVVADLAGNLNTASTSTDNSVIYDNVVPTLTINQGSGQTDPAGSLPVLFDVTFSEPIDPATFTVSDITQSGTASGITWSLSTTDNKNWILKATAVSTEGTLIPSIAAATVSDLAGNSNTASSSTDNSVLYDITAPSLTIEQKVGQADPTNGLPIEFTVTFSEAIDPATFTVADISQGGTAAGITWSLSTANNITWTLAATAVSTPGTLVPSINAGQVADFAGNTNSASTSTDNSVTYDLTAPTLTLEQKVGQSDPANSLPIRFTATFSEPIDPSTFTIADITQNGTATGITWNLTTLDNKIWTIEATSITTAGTVVPSIAANTVKDPAGNNNTASVSADNSVTYDNSAPSVTVDQVAVQADPTNALPISFDVTFSEAIDPLTFTVADIIQNGTATGITWTLTTSNNKNWTLQATAVTTAGTVIPSIAAATVKDLAGNDNTASTSTDNTVTYDITAPSLTLEQKGTQLDPTNALPITFVITFSEPIKASTFTVADITQSGTASGITWSLTTADNKIWTLEATAVTTAGTLIPSVAAGVITDPAGNSNTASVSADNSVTYDITAPTVTLDQAGGQLDPTNATPVNFTVVFSEPIKASTFTAADITQTGTATGITWSLSTSDNKTWNLQATTVSTPGTLIPVINAAKVTDEAGNNNVASTSTDNTVTIDNVGPTVIVAQAGGQLDPTKNLPINFTVTFSEAVKIGTFDVSDITQNGTASGITWSLSTSDNITWTLSATAITTAGTVIPSIAAAKVTDNAGNNNSASTATDNSVTYDITPPTVAITAPVTSPTNTSPFTATFTFSEPVTGFALGDITVGNGTASGFTSVSSTVYTATITPTASGTVTIDVAAGMANDAAGNGNLAATQFSVIYDNTPPTVTVNQDLGQLDPTATVPIIFNVTFSEAINPASFTVADITQNGTATGITWSLSTSNNIDWVLRATAVTTSGTVIPSIAANKVTDVAGNNNTASTATDNTVTYDITGPTVTVAQAAGQLDPTNALPISFTVTFSEAINPASFTAADITQNGTATGITWSLSTANNIVWTLQATAITTAGTVIPSIAANKVTDTLGNNNSASTATDNTVTYDITAPTVAITAPVTSPTNSSPFTATFTFSEPVTGFALADITVGNGTASGFTTVSSTVYTVQITPSASGTVTIDVPANSANDSAGNGNTAATQFSVIYDGVAPTVTVNQQNLPIAQDDPTNALPIKFTVVFSEPINPASFTAADITQSGTASGITWSLSTSDNITWTLSATAVTTAGTLVPSIAASKVTDPAGNNNTASTSGDNSVTYDLTGPTVVVKQQTSPTSQADPTNTLPIYFTVTFSEAVKSGTFDVTDITQNGTASGITWNLTTSDDITWTLSATAITTPGTVVPSIAAAKVTDKAGNNNSASTATDNSVTYDITAPTLAITAPVTNPTNSSPFTATFTFSEPVTGFALADITVGNGTASGFTTVSSTVYTVQITPGSSGTVTIDVAAGVATDLAGNNNLAATQYSVVYDGVAPTVTVNQQNLPIAQDDPTNVLPIKFTVVFSEPINPASFTAADITQSGTASGITWSLSTSDNITWTLSATAVTTAGTLVPSIAASKVTDPAGNNNTASTSTDNSVVYDLTGPTVTVNQSSANDPTNALPITFTVTFSEAVKVGTFDTTDITQNGTASGITWNLSTSDNITWTLSATAITTPGTVVPSIAAAKVTDNAGNNNSASTSTDNSVTYDLTPPTVTVNSQTSPTLQVDPTNTLPISFTVVFSEAIKAATFTTADITQSGTATGVTWTLTTSDNITWTLKATAVTGAGTLIPSIAAGAVTDLAGNNNIASTSTDNSVTYDNVAPTVTINQSGSQADPTSKVPVSFDIVFSEPIEPLTFTTADITQSGTATGVTWSLTTSDNKNWTLQATASGYGTLVPSIAAGKVTDPAGNSNTASTSTDNSVSYIQIFLSIANISVTEGGTATVVASLNSSHDQNVTFNWTTASGTAISGTDFTASSGTGVTIPAGSTTVNLTIPTTNDVLDEDDETFTVTLSSPTVATISAGTATVTILDNDPSPTVAFNTASQTLSETAGTGSITVSLSAVSGRSISVPYTVTGTANNPADHNLASGTLTIPAGSSTGTISFSVVNDLSYESNETIIVTMGTPTNATAGAITAHTVTLTSDDPPPVISIANVTVGEGDPAQFVVTLNAASSVDTTVSYATVDGTALSGTHYTGATGTLTIPAGSTSGIISITTTENATNQNSAEWTFTLNLSSPVNGTLGTSSATGTIQDDDNPPGPFYVTGISGGLDISNDEFLTDGLNPTVNWAKSPGATSYTVVIRDNADTMDVCAQVSTTNLYATFSSCTLTLGQKYKAKVSAWKIASPLAAINSPYTFTVVAPPPSSFTVTGITGGTDVTPDNFLENGTYATVNWNMPSIDVSYTVSIYDAAGTTLVCGPAAVPAGNSSYSFSACVLGANQYRAKVIATDVNGNSTEASNSMYPFQLPKVSTVCVDTSVTNSFLGTIYDSGGAAGSYSKNEICTLLLDPPGNASIDFTFSQFTTRESGDYMYVYDGTSTSGMPNGPLWGSAVPSPITASSGAAFITWNSNNSKQDVGWTMTYKSTPVSPGSFNITGVTSSPTDTTVDTWMNGTTGVPTVAWTASSSAANYDVWISEASGNVIACAKQNTTSTSYTFSTCTLIPGSAYKVFVTSRDSWGLMTQATNSGFDFIYDPGPSAFNILGITGGADTTVNADLSDGYNPTINFEDSTRETSYKITVYLDNGTTVKCSTVTTPPDITSYSLDSCTLDATTYYKVKMEAVSVSGVTKVATNSLYRFYVSSTPAPPGNFNILGVTGNTDTLVDTTLASTTTPTINWQSASRATNYDVTVYNNDGVTVKCPTQNTTGTSYTFSTCTLTNATTYKVAVVAKDPFAQTTSATNSLTFQFIVDISPPGAFNITGVKGGLDVTADAMLLDGNTATIDWGASTDAVSYKVSIYRDDGVTLACTSVFPISTTALTLNVSGCLLTEDYYYKVRVTAVDNVGNEANATNDLYRFRVDAKATISLADATFPEGVGTINAVVTLDHAVMRDTTFNYYTSGSSATSGTDFVAVSSTPIVVPAGTTTYNLPVTITDDITEESTEYFWVNISGANSPVSKSTAQMYIEDNDDDNWVPIKGNFLSWTGITAVYGTQGVPSTANFPSSRSSSASFTDASNNLWLFGGYGLDSVGGNRSLHDLWKFNPTTSEWTWLGGLQSGTQTANYGTKGVAAASNWPGGRSNSAYAVDSTGNFWLFGGSAESPSGAVSDLWKYSPSTGQWTWVSGASSANILGVYGTQGTPSTANSPGARYGAAMWIDASNNIWIFGGYGYAASGSGVRLNDLWKFNPGTGEWTWVMGSNSGFQKGVYGTRGVASGSNIPGARQYPGFAKDASGNFWLFGGEGVDKNAYRGYLNDLWKFDPVSQQWTWVHGSDTVNALNNNYSFRRVTSPTTTPGSRTKANLNFANGYLWVIGGYGESSSASDGNYAKKDLWKFDLSISQWALVKGSTANWPYINDFNPSYLGYTRSLSNPAAGYSRASWSTSDGRLWIFGGYGGYGNQGSGGCCNTLSTFWKFEPDPVTKLIIGDSSTTEGTTGSIYVSLNYPTNQNVTFNWATSNGTATAGTDYTAGSGTNTTISTGSSAIGLSITTATDTTTESNETVNVTISSASNAVIVRTTGVFSIIDDDAKNAVIRGPTSVLANKCSPAYYLESVDSSGNTVNVPAAEAVALGGNGMGTFYSNATCTTSITSVTIASGTSRSPLFYYKNATAENVVFNTSPTTLGSTTLSVTVQAASNTPARLSLLGNPSLLVNSCTLYQVSVRDGSGNPAAVASNTSINLAMDGNNIKIYSDASCTTITSTTTVPSGSSFGVFYLKGTRFDSGRSLMASHGTYGYTKNSVSMSSSSSGLPTRLVVSGPNTVVANACNPYTTTTINDDGLPATFSSSQSLNFLNSASNNGRVYTTANTTCTGGTYANYWIYPPATSATWYFSSVIPGPDIIGTYSNSLSMFATYPIVVTPDQTMKLAISGPSLIVTGSCNAYTINSQDVNGNSVNVASTTTIGLGGVNSGSFYTASDCATTTTSASISAGTSSTTVYYKNGTAPQTMYLTATATGFNSSYYKVVVWASPSRLAWSGPTSLNRAQCGAYTLTNLNSSDTATNFMSSFTIYLGGADLGNFYSDVGCTTPITSLNANTSINSFYIYYKSNYVRPNVAFFALPSGTSSVADGNYKISVNATTDGYGINLSGNNALTPNSCSKYSLSIAANNGEAAIAASNVTVNLGGVGAGAFYSDAGCTASISSSTITSGTTSKDIYYKNASSQVVTLTAADASATLASTSMIVDINYPFTEVSAGAYHACAVRNGAAYCWGSNTYGQLGDGTSNGRSTAVMVTGLSSGVTQVAAGDYFTCALQSGAVKCWGRNMYGQLGNSTYVDSTTPVSVTNLTANVTQISARGSNVCAIQSGAAYCWGYNNYGQVGNNSTASSNLPAAVSGLSSGVTWIEAGGSTSCAIVSGGVKCWGYNGNGSAGQSAGTSILTPQTVGTLTSGMSKVTSNSYYSCAISAAGAYVCWGYNWAGSFGTGGSYNSYIPVYPAALSSGVTEADSGTDTACVVQNGGLFCMGYNWNYQLGVGDKNSRSLPTAVTGLSNNVTKVAFGSTGFACAIANGNLFCWGYNSYGQVGNSGDAFIQGSPVPVAAFPGSASKVAAGMNHTCALTTTGSAYCWGLNLYGQLGDGTTVNNTLPVAVSGTSGTLNNITAGDSHSCATNSTGAAFCWGLNSTGQLGNSSTANSSTAVSPTGLSSNVTAISAGSAHTCAIQSGAAYCWGDNTYGQLGNSSTTASTSPVLVTGLTSGVTSIAAGNGFTCAVHSGAVKCWGSNSTYQLGLYTTYPIITAPILVGTFSSGATQVTVGNGHTCAVVSGYTYCWGNGTNGQFGNGMTITSYVPVLSYVSPNPTAIFGGGYTTCSIENTEARCWGQGNSGQVGYGGSTASVVYPTLVQYISNITTMSVGNKHTCAIQADGKVFCWGEYTYGKLGYLPLSSGADGLSEVPYPTSVKF